jgi:hypothetical protein
MGKKDKKYATEGEPQVNAPATEVTTEPKEPLIPRNPSLFLQHSDGRQFKFDRRELPKKALVAGQIVIDGTPTDFQVTSNKGWAKEEAYTLEYIWVKLPDGTAGYITMDYTVSALTFAGAQFTLGSGKANRDNPTRVGVDEREATRKAAAAATLAKKKAEKDAAATEQQAAEAPAA